MPISLIEFIVYGLIAYSSMLMLVISTVVNPPVQRSLSIARAVYMIPGIICAILLSRTGESITMPTVTTNNTIIALNSSEYFTESTTQVVAFNLGSDVWILVHMAFAIIMTVYIIQQMLQLFTLRE